MNNHGQSGLLGPFNLPNPRSAGKTTKLQSKFPLPGNGLTLAGLLERAPPRLGAVAQNDNPPSSAPRQLQNAWDSTNSLQLVIDEWEANLSEQTTVLNVLDRLDPYEKALKVAEILKIPLEEAKALIKAGRVAGWVWQMIVEELGMRLFRGGVNGELAQIRYWLPIARARQAELFRRRQSR